MIKSKRIVGKNSFAYSYTIECFSVCLIFQVKGTEAVNENQKGKLYK